MKNVKNVFAALAFVFAVGAAFASDVITTYDTTSIKIQQGPEIVCTATSLPFGCDYTSANVCTVSAPSVDNQYYMYEDSEGLDCAVELRQP